MRNKGGINFLTLILVAALVAAAFFVGQFSEKAKDNDPQTVPQAVQEEEGPIVLGQAEFDLIIEGAPATKGDENASITIVEFSEYECPFCKRYVDETYEQIFEEYGDNIYYVFRDYPLPFHNHSQETAEVARCAGDQGSYWPMHDMLFEGRDEWAEETEITSTLTSYAKSLGLDTQAFNSCLSSGKYTQVVKDDLVLGDKVGVSGTPSFFVNGVMLVGAQPFESFKALIESELNK